MKKSKTKLILANVCLLLHLTISYRNKLTKLNKFFKKIYHAQLIKQRNNISH